LLGGFIYAIKDILMPQASPMIEGTISDKTNRSNTKIQLVGIGDSLTKGTGDETGKGLGDGWGWDLNLFFDFVFITF
jgi:lysophospholipase L1-like esterase